MKLTNNILYQEQWVAPRKAWKQIKYFCDLSATVDRILYKMAYERPTWTGWWIEHTEYSTQPDKKYLSKPLDKPF